MKLLKYLFMTIILGRLGSITKARLTPGERQTVLEESKHSPDYCSACLRKAMANHFPHACQYNMPDPITFAKIAGQVQPEVIRCVCLAFVDTQWMRSDCRIECKFTGYDEAMKTIPKVKDFPGCERWVDMKSLKELELQGFPKRDPDYRPVVYNYEFYDETAESTDLRSGDLLKKLTEEEILEEEDYEDCDLDEDEINLVNRIRDEL